MKYQLVTLGVCTVLGAGMTTMASAAGPQNSQCLPTVKIGGISITVNLPIFGHANQQVRPVERNDRWQLQQKREREQRECELQRERELQRAREIARDREQQRARELARERELQRERDARCGHKHGNRPAQHDNRPVQHGNEHAQPGNGHGQHNNGHRGN